MKTSSWFDALALLVISLMSIAAAVATDGDRLDARQALESVASQR